MQLGQFCQTKLTTFMRYSPVQLTFAVPAAPALTTVCAIFSIDKEVVIGFPGSVVTGFTIFKQTAASRTNKQEKGWKKSKHVGICCFLYKIWSWNRVCTWVNNTGVTLIEGIPAAGNSVAHLQTFEGTSTLDQLVLATWPTHGVPAGARTAVLC